MVKWNACRNENGQPSVEATQPPPIPVIPVLDVAPNVADNYDINGVPEALAFVTEHKSAILSVAQAQGISPVLLAGVLASIQDFDIDWQDNMQDTLALQGADYSLQPTEISYTTWRVAYAYYQKNGYEIPSAFNNHPWSLPKDPDKFDPKTATTEDKMEFASLILDGSTDHMNAITASAMVLRMLCEYRAGQDGSPNSDISGLDTTDFAILFGAYRAGVPPITNTIKDSKSWATMEEFQQQIEPGNNAKLAYPYIEYYDTYGIY
jgi:hypothetical protein